RRGRAAAPHATAAARSRRAATPRTAAARSGRGAATRSRRGVAEVRPGRADDHAATGAGDRHLRAAAADSTDTRRRAGAGAAGRVGGGGEGAPPPSRALSGLAGEPRVAGGAGTLEAFGDLERAVLTGAAGVARVYVFREPGHEAERLGELALAVWDGLGRTRDADLGALVSGIFRQGPRRILVRPV